MTEKLNVFTMEKNYDLKDAKVVLGEKLNPKWIKQRKQGGATLSYIGGQTVIRLLNKAFNYQWSFEIITEETVQSLPKVNKWAKGDQPKLEEQPPVAKVLGRLTIPGIGIKEQYGSKVLIGGATEQESAFKAAATDALKKCATLVGVGLELYGEDEGMDDTDEAVESYVQETQVQTPAPTAPKETVTVRTPTEESTPTPEPQKAAPTQTASTPAGGWKNEDVSRLKELKMIMGITSNAQLDPYVKEFFDNPDVTFNNITPENIKAMNIFLAKKAEDL